MNSPADLVREFHEAFGQPVRTAPSVESVHARDKAFRVSLHMEEVLELHRAMAHDNLVGIADGLADAVYVLYGTALYYGIDLDAVLAEVHRSNMTKLGADGEPVRRADGKILKPDTFEAPQIANVLGAVA